MTDVFRLTIEPYTDDLSGIGAGITGGRWNHPGDRVVYTSSSRALATLEVLVHTPALFVPKDYYLLTLRIPEDSLLSIPLDQLPTGWNDMDAPVALRQFADQWIAENRYLVLKVPSAVVTGDYNFLLNPAHPRMNEVKIIDKQPFRFDHRLGR